MQKRERLQNSLHFLGAAKPSNHTVFFDEDEEAAQFDPAEHFDTPAELLGRTHNRPRRSQLAAADLIPKQTAEEAADTANRCVLSPQPSVPQCLQCLSVFSASVSSVPQFSVSSVRQCASATGPQ